MSALSIFNGTGEGIARDDIRKSAEAAFGAKSLKYEILIGCGR
jgi:hypothetical protein